MSVQNVVFRCIYLFYYPYEMNDTEYFPWLPEYVLHEFLLKSHKKQSNANCWKEGFRELLKLVYYKTQQLDF